MRQFKNCLLILVLFTALFFASPVSVQAAQTSSDGEVVLGGTYTLKSGDTLNGGLVVIGGQATLEKGSSVYGDILITGGTLSASGEIFGSVTAIGGSINLEVTAVVHGDVNTVGSVLNKSDEAVITGALSFDVPSDMDFNFLPKVPFASFDQPKKEPFGINLQPVWDFLWAIFQAIALAAFAALLSLFLQKPIERVAGSFMASPFASWGLGLLTMVVAPGLLILLVVTIILIPLGLIGILALGLCLLFGWVAIGYELGKRMEALFHQTWAPAVSIGLGTLVLSLTASLFNAIPCVGWTIPILVSMFGLGGVFLSRFGTITYNPSAPHTVPAGGQESKPE